MASPPDPATTPAAPRPPRQAMMPRWLIVVMAAIAFLVAAGWWTQRPLARIPLPDGSELLLVEVYYGKTLDRTGFWERIRLFLSGDRRKAVAPAPRLAPGSQDSKPGLWLVFENRDPHWNRATLQSVSTVEKTSSGNFAGVAGACSLNGTTHDRRITACLRNYPRRAPQLHLLLHLAGETVGTQIVEATIRNPFPVLDSPQWTAGELPQSHQLRYGEMVLKGLELRKNPEGYFRDSFTIIPDIDVRSPGASSPRDYQIDSSFSDATGNESTRQLPLSEPAWKIHVSLSPRTSYPFPKSDIEAVVPTTMPGRNEFRLLPLPPDPVTGVVHHAALAGPGEYRVGFADDLSIEQVPLSGDKDVGQAADGRAEYRFTEPIFLVRRVDRVLANQAGLRILHILHNADTITLDQFYAGGEPPDRPWRCILKNETHPENGAPPPGAALEIQSIVMTPESTDFFVRPPR